MQVGYESVQGNVPPPKRA